MWKNTWNAENKEKKAQMDRSRHYRKKYGDAMREQHGIDGQEGYDYLFNIQEGKCKLCGIKSTKFVHDHCHKTGKVRGLVCLPCNTAIGGYETICRMPQEEVDKYFSYD